MRLSYVDTPELESESIFWDNHFRTDDLLLSFSNLAASRLRIST